MEDWSKYKVKPNTLPVSSATEDWSKYKVAPTKEVSSSTEDWSQYKSKVPQLMATSIQQSELSAPTPGSRRYVAPTTKESMKMFTKDTRGKFSDNPYEVSPGTTGGFSGIFGANKINAIERAKIGFGNDAGKVRYLKDHFDDATLNSKGELVVKDKGFWYRVNPKGLDIGDVANLPGHLIAPLVSSAYAIPTIAATGGNPLAVTAMTGLGGSAGEALRQIIGTAVGTNYMKTPGEAAKSIAAEGALMAAPVAVGYGIAKLKVPMGETLKTLAREDAKSFGDTILYSLGKVLSPEDLSNPVLKDAAIDVAKKSIDIPRLNKLIEQANKADKFRNAYGKITSLGSTGSDVEPLVEIPKKHINAIVRYYEQGKPIAPLVRDLSKRYGAIETEHVVINALGEGQLKILKNTALTEVEKSARMAVNPAKLLTQAAEEGEKYLKVQSEAAKAILSGKTVGEVYQGISKQVPMTAKTMMETLGLKEGIRQSEEMTALEFGYRSFLRAGNRTLDELSGTRVKEIIGKPLGQAFEIKTAKGQIDAAKIMMKIEKMYNIKTTESDLAGLKFVIDNKLGRVDAQLLAEVGNSPISENTWRVAEILRSSGMLEKPYRMGQKLGAKIMVGGELKPLKFQQLEFPHVLKDEYRLERILNNTKSPQYRQVMDAMMKTNPGKSETELANVLRKSYRNSLDRPFAHLERERLLRDPKFDFMFDLDPKHWAEQWNRGIYDRLRTIQSFGSEGEKLDLALKVMEEEFGSSRAELARRIIRQNQGLPEVGWESGTNYAKYWTPILKTARAVNFVTDLALTPIQNIGSGNVVAMALAPRQYAKSIYTEFADKDLYTQMAREVGTASYHPQNKWGTGWITRTFRKSSYPVRLGMHVSQNATQDRSSVVFRYRFRDIFPELANKPGNFMQQAKHKRILMEFADYGVNPDDLIKRFRPEDVAALNSGKMSGQQFTARYLRKKEELLFANRAVHKLQTLREPGAVPPAWNGEVGKTLTQYKNYSYRLGKDVLWDIIIKREAGNGNLVPLTMWLIGSQAVGEGYADTRELIKVIASGGQHEFKRAEGAGRVVENMAYGTSVGIFADSLMGMISYPSKAMTTLLGPTFGKTASLLEGTAQVGKKLLEGEPTMKPLIRPLTSLTPYGKQLIYPAIEPLIKEEE